MWFPFVKNKQEESTSNSYQVSKIMNSRLLFSHIFETFFSRVMTIIVSVLITVLVARNLGPESQGMYAVAVALVAVGVQFGNFGLNASNTYFVSKDRRLFPQLFGNTLLISAVIGGGIGLIGYVIGVLFPDLSPAHGVIQLMVIVCIPFALAFYLLQNLLLGVQEIRTYNIINFGVKLLLLIIILIFILRNQVSVDWFFLAVLISTFISFVWVIYVLNKKLDTSLALSKVVFNKTFRYGLKAYMAAFFAYLVLKSDLLMIQYMLGNKESGYYSISANLAELLFTFPVVIGTILFPKLSSMSAWSEKWLLTKKTGLVAGLFMLLLCIFLFIFSNEIVMILFGEAYQQSVLPFLWLLPGVFFLGIEVVLVQSLNSIGFPVSIVYLWLAVSITNIILNIWLIPVYEIIGAAVSSSMSYLIVFAGVLLLCQKTNSIYKIS